MNKNRLVIFVSLIAVVLFVSCGILFVQNKMKFYENAHINPEMLYINSTATGVVKDIYVKPEEKVSRGQLVAEIEVAKPSKPQVAAVQKSDVASAQARLKEAEENYKNFALMYKDGVISQEDYDNSLSNLTTAQNAYKSALTKSKTTSNKVKLSTEPEIKKVYAQRDGVIDSYLIKKGEQIKQEQPLMVQAVNTQKVTAYVDDKTVPALKTGQNVKIKIHTFRDKTFDGQIELISDTPYDIDGYKTPMYIVYIGFKSNVESYGFTPFQSASVSFGK